MSVPRSLLTVVLAAGEGTRMKSALPKVLHKVAGRSMVGHVMHAALGAGGEEIAVIVGPQREDVAAEARGVLAGCPVYVQDERLGTAHAALKARDAIARQTGDIIIAFGDTPLVRAETFKTLRAPLASGAAVVVAAFVTADPTGYGRVLREGDTVVAIREEKDASAEERKVTLVNGGLMALDGPQALALLDAVENNNAKGEYYLTDVVELAHRRGLKVAYVTIDEEEVLGVNNRQQLAECERIYQKRAREYWMAEGVSMVAPETVFLCADTQLASDVWIGPNVTFGPGVRIERGTEILSFCHIEGAHVAGGARIGPFARLRPKTSIGAGVHIGNFVEINRTTLEEGVEVNHLTYLGDARVGASTNVGAGTITCNFDGADKHTTTIGKDVFVGSNSTLVAPLVIGDEVLIGAGSVVTQDAPDGALVFGRVKAQATIEGRGAEKIRANKVRRAARKAKGG